MKNLIVVLVLLITNQMAFSKPNCDKEKQERMNQQLNDKIIQTIVNAINFEQSALNFNFQGKTSNKKNELGLKVLVYLKFSRDLFFNIVGDGLQVSNECSDNEKLSFLIDLDTKDLILKVSLVEQGNKGALRLEFVSVVNKNNEFSFQEKPLVLKLESNLNRKILQYNLHSVDFKYDRNNEKRIALQSTCKLTQNMANIITGISKPVEAECYLNGTIENGNESNINWGVGIPEPSLTIQ